MAVQCYRTSAVENDGAALTQARRSSSTTAGGDQTSAGLIFCTIILHCIVLYIYKRDDGGIIIDEIKMGVDESRLCRLLHSRLRSDSPQNVERGEA